MQLSVADGILSKHSGAFEDISGPDGKKRTDYKGHILRTHTEHFPIMESSSDFVMSEMLTDYKKSETNPWSVKMSRSIASASTTTC